MSTTKIRGNDMKLEIVVIPVSDVQEVTTRLAGRIDAGVTSFASVNDLAAAFRRAEAAHGKYEATRLGGQRDANWPEWYAAYMAAEQAGTELPS